MPRKFWQSIAARPRARPGWLSILHRRADWSEVALRLTNGILGGFVTLSSRGLGHRPFTAVTRVRIPLGSPFDSAFTKASLMTTLRAANCKQGWRRWLVSRMALSERSESNGS